MPWKKGELIIWKGKLWRVVNSCGFGATLEPV